MSSNTLSPNDLADAVENVAGQVAKTSHRLVDDASHFAQSGSDMLRHRADQLQAGAVQARDSTLDYIQREPVKAVLMAAAAGAMLMWMGSLLSGRSPR